MPGFDGTGPAGEGAMTGGGFGRCGPQENATEGVPRMTYGLGRGGRPWGGGRGRGGRGRSRGWRRGNFLPANEMSQVQPSDEVSTLRVELQALTAKLAQLCEKLGSRGDAG